MSRLPNHVTLELTEADWDEAAEAYKDSRPCEIEDWELCQHCALSVAAVRQIAASNAASSRFKRGHDDRRQKRAI